MKDCFKGMDLNDCIKSQKQVSSNAKIDAAEKKLKGGDSLVKNTTLTAGNKESSKNETKHDDLVEKNSVKRKI